MVKKKRRAGGFASMPSERVAEIASLGGKSLKPESRSFSRNRELAAEAGRLGGLKSQANRRGKKIALPAKSK